MNISRKQYLQSQIAVKSKGKGKSGGLRIISYHDIILAVQSDKLYLVAIYDKSETPSIEQRKIDQILRKNAGMLE